MIRLLHLTDLHMRRVQPGASRKSDRLSRAVPDLLDELLGRFVRLAPDMVVMTGDLLDVPDVLLNAEPGADLGPDPGAGLAAMEEAAVGDYRLLRTWLERTGRPWMVLPGNHDHAAAFDRVFGDRPRAMELNGVAVHAFHDWEEPGRFQARRKGAERQRFEALLTGADAARGPAPVEVHLQHYVVHPPLETGYPLNYAEAEEMTAALAAAAGTRLVLSGHWHQGSEPVTVGNATFCTARSFCEAPHPYRLHTVDAAGGAVHSREETLV